MSNNGPPHPNVIQYLLKEEDSEAMYIALQMHKGNLRELVREAVSRRDEGILSQLTSRECLRQISEGVGYLHGCDIEHRDIKPTNILWDFSRFGKLRFIVSDFDLGHFSGEKSSHRTKYGSMGWSAPELWEGENRTRAVDIFSLGCVFFYVLTRGGHPFDSPGDIKLQESIELWQGNIMGNRFSLKLLVECGSKFEAELANDLIGSMIQHDILDFYHRIGNYMENKKDSKHLVEQLECNSSEVFEGSWMDTLDPAVKSDLKGFKEQKGHVCGLLRVIRNKTEHFLKLGPKLKAIYISPEGVVHYYNNHFPKLLLHTYYAWQEVKDQL